MNDELKKLFDQIAENAPKIREGMEQAAQGLSEKQKNIEIIGKAGVDAVKITVNAVPEVISVELSDSFSSYSKNEQQILIKAALEDGFSQLKSQLSSLMSL